jgi:glycopeptide antibiotics resistance protein
MRLVGLIASVVVILMATLMPWSNFVGHAHWTQVQWVPVAASRWQWFDIIGNILLFVPFGFFAGCCFPEVERAKKIIAISIVVAVISTSVETIQVYSHSRFPSTMDIVSNLAGALVGCFVALRWGSTSL